jgi:hypothetical protein
VRVRGRAALHGRVRGRAPRDPVTGVAYATIDSGDCRSVCAPQPRDYNERYWPLDWPIRG